MRNQTEVRQRLIQLQAKALSDIKQNKHTEQFTLGYLMALAWVMEKLP